MAEANGRPGKSDISNQSQTDAALSQSLTESRHEHQDMLFKGQPKLTEGENATGEFGDLNPRHANILSPVGSKPSKSKAKRQKPALTEDEKRKLDKMVSKMELCLTLGALKFQAVYRGTPRHSPEPFDLFSEFGDAVNTSNIMDDEWQDVKLTEPGWWFILHPRPSTLAVDPLSPDANPINSFSVDDIANFMHVRYAKEKAGHAGRRRAPRSAPLSGDIHCHLIYRPTPLPNNLRTYPPRPLQDYIESRLKNSRKSSDFNSTTPPTSSPSSPIGSPTKSRSLSDSHHGFPEPEPSQEDEELTHRYLAMAAIYESDNEVEIQDVDVLPIKKKYWSPNSRIVLSRPRKSITHPSYLEALKRDSTTPPITIYELPQSEYRIRLNPALPSARKKMTNKDGSRLAGVSIRTVFHADRSLFEEQTDHLLLVLKGSMIEGILLHVPFGTPFQIVLMLPSSFPKFLLSIIEFLLHLSNKYVSNTLLNPFLIDSLPQPFQNVAGRVANEWAEYHRAKQGMFHNNTEVFFINRFAPPDQRVTEDQEDPYNPYNSDLLYPEQMDRRDLRLALMNLGFTATQGIPTIDLRKKLRQMAGMEPADALDEANIPMYFRRYRDYALPDLPDLPKVDLDVDISEDDVDLDAEEDLTDADDLMEMDDDFDSDSDSEEDSLDETEHQPKPLHLSPTKVKRSKSRQHSHDEEDNKSQLMAGLSAIDVNGLLPVDDLPPPTRVQPKRKSSTPSLDTKLKLNGDLALDDDSAFPHKKIALPPPLSATTASELLPDPTKFESSSVASPFPQSAVASSTVSGTDIDLAISDSLLSLAEAFRSKSPSLLSSPAPTTQLLSMIVPDPFSNDLKSWVKEDRSRSPSGSDMDVDAEDSMDGGGSIENGVEPDWLMKIKRKKIHDLAHLDLSNCNPDEGRKPRSSSLAARNNLTRYTRPGAAANVAYAAIAGSEIDMKLPTKTSPPHASSIPHQNGLYHHHTRPRRSRKALANATRELRPPEPIIIPHVSVPIDATAEEYALAMERQLEVYGFNRRKPDRAAASRDLLPADSSALPPAASAAVIDTNLTVSAPTVFPTLTNPGLLGLSAALDPRLAALRPGLPLTANPLELAQLSLLLNSAPLMPGLGIPGFSPFGLPGAGFGFLPFPTATPYLQNPVFTTAAPESQISDPPTTSPAEITKSL